MADTRKKKKVTSKRTKTLGELTKTVFLRAGKESGQWMYSLSSTNRATSTVTTATGAVQTIIAMQRIPRDLETGEYLNDPVVQAEQATYNFHYVLLDDEYTGCDKSELIADGWTDSGQLNVMTGHFEIIEG